MAVEVNINLPDEVAKKLSEGGEDLTRVALEGVAIKGYTEGKLSHAQIQELLGFRSRFETDQFLKDANISFPGYDLDTDIGTNEALRGK